MPLYTSGTGVATDTQLMNEFLLPGATAGVKQEALVGARYLLGLAPGATAAATVAALKADMRRKIRNAYRRANEEAARAGASASSDSAATAALWAESEN